MINVFKGNYLSWSRPAAWWSNIRSFFRRFKWAWQRATRGFADCDIWDLDSSLLNYLSGTLKYLAENHWGWPGDKRFPRDEDWTEFLQDMSQKFYQANESNEFYPTPKADEWWDCLTKRFKESSPKDYNEDEQLIELKDLMLEEDRENSLKRERDFAEAWSAIGEAFWNLWD